MSVRVWNVVSLGTWRVSSQSVAGQHCSAAQRLRWAGAAAAAADCWLAGAADLLASAQRALAAM
eukprot:7148152-Prymnesium_polylepis.1